jgi:insulysin
MIEFYTRFILPSSPLRSKLAVHLKAQRAADTEVSKLEGDLVVTKLWDDGTRPCIIEDVSGFKSMMMFSEGPQPIKDIKEYEDLDKKVGKA